MGSEGLTTDSGELRTWLRSLPHASDTSDALDRLGAIAAAVAEAMGVSPPQALPQHEPVPIPAGHANPDLLGLAWEAIMAAPDRRQQGAHFTPAAAAGEIVAVALERRVFDDVPVVWDPTCGGGAFLLAAARRLQAAGHSAADIVRACHGTDIDPVALAVTDAALELWCGGAARPHTECIDLLTTTPTSPSPGAAALVVGNPPFLGQLTADTARSDDRRRLLVERFGEAAKGYVDDVGLIMLAAVEHAADDAIVALVAPESFLGARDARRVRSAIADRAALDAVWLESGGTFEANVDVVAPVLTVGGAGTRTALRGAIDIEVPRPPADNWAPLLAAAAGVPVLEPVGQGVLGDLADVTAGFRQHFYGLRGAVREADDLAESNGALVTSGAIDLLANLWGRRPIRFGGDAWERPVVDIEQIEDPGVAAWFAARVRPKLLVASQTRVLEAIVDGAGTMLPSVPVISVEPTDPSRLWHVAAVLCSPVASALIAASSAGTGLSRGALRIRASELLSLPLPPAGGAWDAAAQSAQAAQAAADAGDAARHRAEVGNVGRNVAVAYGIDHADGLVDWWCDRIRFPEQTPPGVE